MESGESGGLSYLENILQEAKWRWTFQENPMKTVVLLIKDYLEFKEAVLKLHPNVEQEIGLARDKRRREGGNNQSTDPK